MASRTQAVARSENDLTAKSTVWNAILHHLVDDEPIQFRDLGLPDSLRVTSYRCLREMEAIGWVDKSEDEQAWVRGDVADALLITGGGGGH